MDSPINLDVQDVNLYYFCVTMWRSQSLKMLTYRTLVRTYSSQVLSFYVFINHVHTCRKYQCRNFYLLKNNLRLKVWRPSYRRVTFRLQNNNNYKKRQIKSAKINMKLPYVKKQSLLHLRTKNMILMYVFVVCQGLRRDQ